MRYQGVLFDPSYGSDEIDGAIVDGDVFQIYEDRNIEFFGKGVVGGYVFRENTDKGISEIKIRVLK